LGAETTNHFQTGDLKHETTIGFELIKNLFVLSSENNNFQTINKGTIPSPFVIADFASQKNFLNFYIEHEITLTKQLSLSFEGTLDVAIADNTDLPEIPTLAPQEYNNFSPELELSYQLTNGISLYLNFSHYREPIEGSSYFGEPFNSEIYNGLEAGVELEILLDKLFFSLYFYDETQKNITTFDPDRPEYELQINEQKSQSFGLELTGEILPGWDIYLYYQYTDARITEDERLETGKQLEDVANHSGGFWTTYEIQTDILKGLGFGGGIWIVGDRPGDLENTFSLSSYLQMDAVMFYQTKNWKAAISVQNLFNADVNYSDGTPLTIIGTFWVRF